MTSVPEFMTLKHRECDDYFTEAESAVAQNNWTDATTKFDEFKKELLMHLAAEEQTLFPQFEQATGMTSGPTHVMRMEHEQMRAILNDLSAALASNNKDDYLGYSETLMVLMQQHNMKEEMMLYPMAAQHISDQASLLTALKADCAG
ncbi:hemerythrin domain-containing protein [Thalassotalea sp. G2M2-11]|uniref:hemerythrin domain-containing protein n=1 Tax=Thalassotalea sp. G2M2-11 TaxID=2787627 RepID=UPI0019D2A606|nr:hemerythrin domain-containing protein [Thalassotalea sp. G2M2-11]